MSRNLDTLKTIDNDLVSRFAAIVGDAHALTIPDDQRPYLIEWRDRFVGKTPVVLRPGSVSEVCAIVRLAGETGTGLVPQGGNTGLVGGQIPFETGTDVVVSLTRLNAIRDVDTDGNTLVAEAGVTLQAVQDAAAARDRFYPLSLASEGSCQIGGTLATNAGGTGVLAYGSARDLCLGIEAVMPDGRVYDGLNRLRKDNTGYDLKDLLIGSEGTLGIITAAVLKLHPKPNAIETVFAGVETPDKALSLFNRLREATGPMLTAFEFIPRIGLDYVLRYAPGSRDPFNDRHPWYALIEVSSGVDHGLRERLETTLTEAFETGEISDAALAETESQRTDFWHLRTMLSEVQRYEGGSIKHDVSVPVSHVPAFIAEASEAVIEMVPGARPVPFGHLGDGNVHFNVSQPVGADRPAFLARWEEMNDLVHAIVLKHGGSISAEHGIGRMKRNELARVKSPVALDLMRAIKAAIDPKGIMNPGKLL
ncbi:MAG: FAD-binding oxidoreductase [Pseudomonadota bacterium]